MSRRRIMLVIGKLILVTLQGLLASLAALSLTMVLGLLAFPVAPIAGVIWGAVAFRVVMVPTKLGLLVVRIANVFAIVIAAALGKMGAYWLDAAERSARKGGGLLGGLGYLPIALGIMICLVSVVSLLALWPIRPPEKTTA